MINQPFAPTVWFLFVTPYKYEDLEATSVVQFDVIPKGVYTSKQKIFTHLNEETEDLKEQFKEHKEHWSRRIVDSKRQWKKAQKPVGPEIQFAAFDGTAKVYEKELVGKPPSWLKAKRITMEIWEYQSYYNNTFDGSDVYCFVEVRF